jgi:hypothetical protein
MKKGFINLVAVIVSMKRKRLVCASLYLMSCLPITLAQEKLSFSPELGSKWEFQTDVVQNIKQTANGREMTREEKVVTTYLMSIKNKNAKETEVQLTYQDISYVMTSPMAVWGYDSKKTFENPTNRDGSNVGIANLDKMHERIFGSVIGKTITVAIAPDGSVNSVSGIEAIAESITQAIANDGEMGASLSSTMIKQFFTENAMKELIEQSWKIYPVADVKVGDSWNMENKWGEVSNMMTSTKSQYALRHHGGGIALVGVEAAVEVDMTGGRLTGNQSGNLQISLKKGMPDWSLWTRNVKGDVVSMGMNMVMEVTHRTRMATNVVKDR